ncbi:hypothetical protein FB45DRAFT_935358 [Roridomyces roridus]|uniref:Autophagy-related protein 4 n=1 Tax=Roridomyces roridus TaxID=1738132 RepID=A0AAD7FCU6_9AGAR|nr:hypothetical protein FB45DRAFT_935358 [Roridomyces roridus]
MPSSSSSKRAPMHRRQTSASATPPSDSPSASASSSMTLSPNPPSPPLPIPATPSTPASKLPRFLQSPLQRDRSKSLSVDRPPSAASSSASHSTSHSTSTHSSSSHGSGGGRRFLGMGGSKEVMKERDRQRIREAERRAPSAAELLTLQEGIASQTSYGYDTDLAPGPESPTLRAHPRSRTHSVHRFSMSHSTPPSSSGHGSDYNGGQTLQLQRSPSRLGADSALATRLSGWFAHLSGSTSDLSLTGAVSGALSQSASTAAALSTSTSSRKDDKEKGGKTSLLDKAVRYLLDGDAAPDRSTHEIWLMGRRMDGWSENDEARVAAAAELQHSKHGHAHSSSSELPDPGAWPAAFYAAFHALVWCTYRAGFEPIRDLPSLSSLPPPLSFPHTPSSPASPHSSNHGHGHTHKLGHSPSQSDSSEGHASTTSHVSSTASSYASSSNLSTSTGTKKRWWALGGAGTKGWTSDAGWGCMLRTAQSLLAESLVRVGTGIRPHSPEHARLISWFLDAPAAPFGVHRMALAGKAAGKDVGMWFGPSAAASAVRTLVDGFPTCGLGVCVGVDGTLYQSDVYAASSSSSRRGKQTRWGDRPVLLLLGIRLGLDGVNPVYYDTIKALYTFPQSVGIAGGRPSSSYYFVGVQDDGLFYLDPHHSRPAVPLRPFVPGSEVHDTHDTRRSLSPEAYTRGGSMSPPGSFRSGSMSPDSASYPHARGMGRGHSPMTEDELFVRTSSVSREPSAFEEDEPAGGRLAPAEAAFYMHAYSPAELATFHCARVRKMPLSGLDPSMLLGFVCRDEEEWVDLRRRVAKLPRTIFAIQDEPPSWPGVDDDDDALGMESVSDPEEESIEDVGLDDGDVSSTSHAVSASSHAAHGGHSHSSSNSSSAFSHTHVHAHSTSSTASSSGVDTDPPLTPLPNARFDISPPPPVKGGVPTAYSELLDDGADDGDDFVDASAEVDIEDDWVDPVPPAPVMLPPAPAPVAKRSKSSAGKGKKKERERERGKKAVPVPVPVPSVHYPFPVSVEDASSPPPASRAGATQQRMHTARARDGGRTQSGGVRGILTEDT